MFNRGFGIFTSCCVSKQLRCFRWQRFCRRTLTERVCPSDLLKNSKFLISHDVIVSSSHDIYTNLALEDWIYKNCDFSNRNWPLLMIWRNSPCVVIGRHQNPWTECHLSKMNELNVALARRNSGGGTVYHDLGNLNCTFFTERSMYSRKNNLNLICEALRKRWMFNLSISPREDVLLNESFKISGTAAKLGRSTAYHHFTILFAVDKEVLSSVLKTELTNGLESKASKSIRSPVKNLKDVADDVDFESLTHAIDDSFRQHYPAAKHPTRLLIPGEDEFTGLTTLRQQLLSWEWLFGKCPPFKLVKKWLPWNNTVDNLSAITGTIQVRGGIIEAIQCQRDKHWQVNSHDVSELVGKPFPQQQSGLEQLFHDFPVDTEKAFLFNNIAKMMLDVL